MTQYFIDAMKAVWEWLLALVKVLIETVIAPIAEKIPDLSGGWDLGPVSQFFGFVNTWIALDWGVSLLVLYFVFILVMLGIKFAMKFIPTMPG